MMEAEAFFTEMMKPDAPDGMNFQLEREHPDGETTFSAEGLENISSQIHDYIMARIMGRWKNTGIPPTELGVHVRLRWNKHVNLDIEPWPWYDLFDVGESQPFIDGSNREKK